MRKEYSLYQNNSSLVLPARIGLLDKILTKVGSFVPSDTWNNLHNFQSMILIIQLPRLYKNMSP